MRLFFGRGAAAVLPGIIPLIGALYVLIDTLVIRGYLERGTDPEDRRRLTLELTERVRHRLARRHGGVFAT